MKVNDFLDFPVPEPKYKIPITKSAEEPISAANLVLAEHILAPDHTEVALQAS